MFYDLWKLLRSITTKQIPNHEKSTVKIVGKFMAFLLAIVSSPPQHCTAQLGVNSTIPRFHPQARRSRVQYICNILTCLGAHKGTEFCLA